MTVPGRILIVGGGTAGWMAANLMCLRWMDRGVAVSLLESPDIGTIGVGEGSTPQLHAFFDGIGADEADWMPKCNASYKVGIAFDGWSTRTGFDGYFHPFPADADTRSYAAFVHNCYLRRHGIDVDAHPDRYFLPAQLARLALGPRPDGGFSHPMRHAYHFDAGLLGGYLRDNAVAHGVTHVLGNVVAVERHESGDIAAVELADGRRIAADFFIDSTGFRGLLIQQELGVKFRSFAGSLFNDAAVVLPTPPHDPLHSHTRSSAMRHGWAWDIPLTNRTGNGYVYSSAFCTPDEAELELRQKLGLVDSDVAARHLAMKVGRVERHWHRNCLAVGLSQGFIEPLEATALHIVQETIERFVDAVDGAAGTDDRRDAFNRTISRRFDGIRDYIVCHYRVNSRSDTEYWRANAANENLSDSLRLLLAAWLRRDDLTAEILRQDIAQYYNTISWHCLLAGYGVFPDEAPRPAAGPAETRYSVPEIERYVAQCGRNFRPHAEQLQFRDCG